MNLERVVWTQIRFLFMAIWARFWVVHSGWRRRCVRWSGFLGLRGLGLSIFVGLLSVRGNKSNMLSFQLINCGRKLGFPRDVPGQSGTGRPVVPLSQDKKISFSHCSFVPGQGQEQKSWEKLLCPGMSREVLGQNYLPKNIKKQEKDILKQKRMF